MVPADLRRRYNEIADVVGVVAGRVRDVVLAFCDDQGYAYLGRKKRLESLAEKIESGRFSKLSDLDDLFACTVVIPTLRHEAGVITYLCNEFTEQALRRRGEVRQDPEVFRFGATRFIGTIRPGPMGEDSLAAVRFEVQVCTAFEHAWSVAVHDLSYKGDKVDWKLDRLAAQLKASVEQLDLLVATYEQAAQTLIEHPWPALQDRRQLLEHFRNLVDTGKTPSENAPQRWGQFAKNVCGMLEKAKPCGRFAQLSRNERIPFILAACDEEIRERGCPRTISLFQFVLGNLIQRNSIELEFRDRYYPLITDDLETRFPKTSLVLSRFSIGD